MIYTILSTLLAACIGWIAWQRKKIKEILKNEETTLGQKLKFVNTKYAKEFQKLDKLSKNEILSYKHEIDKLKKINEDIRRNFRNKGEIITHYILGQLKSDLINKGIITNEEMIIMPNLFIPSENGTSRQLDHLVLLPTGLYVIETKHWKGHIVLGMTKKNSGKFSFLKDLLGSSTEETIIFKKETSGISVNTNYGNPITQVSGSAFILSEYLKKKSVQVGWIDSIVFFNHDDKKLYDWSANPKVKRFTEKNELIQFFRNELTAKNRKYSGSQLQEIKDHIEKTNYISEATTI